MEIIVEKAKNGSDIAKIKYQELTTSSERTIYLCSKYNPQKEAKDWIDQIYTEEIEVFLVYGLGIGYHLYYLYSLLEEHQKIYVIELNQYIWQFQQNNLIQDKNNQIVYEYISDTQACIQYLDQIIKSSNKIKIMIHKPSLDIIPSHMQDMREVMEKISISRQQTFRAKNAINQIRENYERHAAKQYSNVTRLISKDTYKTLILVSAGPSLEEEIAWLKEVEENVCIFATGRALKRLIQERVRVDYFCIIDSDYEATIQQIEGIENMDIPLVFLNTAAWKTIEAYDGPKYIAYSEDSPVEVEGRILTGGSVATAILSIGLLMAVERMIFVGQDLGYPYNKTHVEGAVGEDIKESQRLRMVKSVNGDWIPTTYTLLSFKKWIEQTIKKHPKVEFINCTSSGAYIEGCKHRRMKDIIK